MKITVGHWSKSAICSSPFYSAICPAWTRDMHVLATTKIPPHVKKKMLSHQNGYKHSQVKHLENEAIKSVGNIPQVATDLENISLWCG